MWINRIKGGEIRLWMDIITVYSCEITNSRRIENSVYVLNSKRLQQQRVFPRDDNYQWGGQRRRRQLLKGKRRRNDGNDALYWDDCDGIRSDTLTMQSGNDTTITGSQVSGKTVKVVVGGKDVKERRRLSGLFTIQNTTEPI